MTPAPSPEHQAIVRNLSFLLMEFLREVLVGEIFFAPIDVLLPGGSAAPIQPDLLFLSRDRLGLVKERAIEGAPDLIVEVLSPSNWLVDRRDKYELYATAGVREYWIVDPKLKAIEVFVQRAGSFELLGRFEEGQSPRSEVLEGFRFSIDQLFVR